MRHLLVFALIGSAASNGAWAQNAGAPLSSLAASIVQLNDRARSDSALPAAKLTKLHSQVGDLTSLYGQSYSVVPTVYAQSLQFDADRLQQARTMSPDDAAWIISGVASDIDAKHKFALSANLLGGQPPAAVSVTVEIKRNGQTLSGYIVRWAPQLWPDTIVSEFNGDPLHGDLSPGLYIATALLNGTVAISQPKPVGLGGHSNETIDILLP